MNKATLADAVESLIDTNNDKIYCASGTVWGGDDTGNVPSDVTIGKCENARAKGVAKLIGGIAQCHCARASGRLADESQEELCEDSPRMKFLSKFPTVCDLCQGTMTGLVEFVEDQVDGAAGLIYCASPSGAFLDDSSVF